MPSQPPLRPTLFLTRSPHPIPIVPQTDKGVRFDALLHLMQRSGTLARMQDTGLMEGSEVGVPFAFQVPSSHPINTTNNAYNYGILRRHPIKAHNNDPPYLGTLSTHTYTVKAPY